MTTETNARDRISTPHVGRREELRLLLNERRQELMATLHDRIENVRAGHSPTAGVLDEEETSEADMQEEIELALIEIKTETLRRIDDALARLDAGLYGRCDSCGQEISRSRLRALPFAVRCRDCEELYESERAVSLRLGRRPAGTVHRLPGQGL